jgi:hypothetical protein
MDETGMLIKKLLEKRSGKIMTRQITAENNGDAGGGNAPALTAPTIAGAIQGNLSNFPKLK